MRAGTLDACRVCWPREGAGAGLDGAERLPRLRWMLVNENQRVYRHDLGWIGGFDVR